MGWGRGGVVSVVTGEAGFTIDRGRDGGGVRACTTLPWQRKRAPPLSPTPLNDNASFLRRPAAGIIAADLARQLLLVYPNTYALIVSTENLTNNWYPGSNRGMLVTNTIFRVGGAAVLMTNKRSEAR